MDVVFVVVCETVVVRFVDFGVMVLELDSFMVWSWVVGRNGILVEWLAWWM